MYKKMIF